MEESIINMVDECNQSSISTSKKLYDSYQTSSVHMQMEIIEQDKHQLDKHFFNQ